jgi:hypothetical protein
MPEMPKDEDRFYELLPFYLNQTLDASDKGWMESHFSTNKLARQQLQFEKVLRATVQETQPKSNEAERLSKLLKALAADRKSRKSAQGLMGWWNAIAWGPRLSIPVPALATCGVLILGQAIYIAAVNTEKPVSGQYRGSAAHCAGNAGIKLHLKPDAKFPDLVLELRKVEATLGAGPSESGEIWITLPAGRSPQEALVLLRTSPVIEDAMLGTIAAKQGECSKK